VFFPERAPWLPNLESELFTFPGSRHDDQCDSISQALLDTNISFWMWLSPDDWQRILEES
jgi:phage terminase large subunit-like protein